MDELSVSNHLELQQAWDGKVDLQNNWFYSLETLKLENCEIQPYAIPSNVLPSLKSLKELAVWNCHNVEGIFDTNENEEITFQLKKLTLRSLKGLTNVWEKNCQGILNFQNLQEVSVWECHNLKTLFPTATAKNLKKLEKLGIERCDRLQVIVGKEEAAAAEATEMFEFPRLTWLRIERLTQLTDFYPGRYILECPELNYLYVSRYDGFLSQCQQAAHQVSASNAISEQKCLGLEHSWMAPFPHTLETLTIRECDRLTNLVPSTVSFSHLTELRVSFCIELEYLFTSSTAKSLGVLKRMDIAGCDSLRKIVEPEPEDDEMIFGKLKILSLSYLAGLISFYTGNSALKFPSLKEVSFTRCPKMRMFSHGDVSVPENLEGEIGGVCWSGDIDIVQSSENVVQSSPKYIYEPLEAT